MTNLKKQAISVATAGAMLLQLAGPAFANTTIQISGNGAFSDSDATVNQTQTTTVVQDNVANIDNNVDVDADTGGNDASFNNGGNVTVDTGNATTNVTASTTANTNSATVSCGACAAAGNVNVLVDNNAAYSNNDATLNMTNKNQVAQNNNADVDNDVDVDADTGGNDANFNNGGSNGGDVVIRTGNANTTVDLMTVANANSARIGSGSTNGGSALLRIGNNAAFSDNDLTLNLTRDNYVTQKNVADVDNDVDVDADTGDNDASFNNGGDVIIDTGNATTTVDVDNLVNFNSADLNCGCLFAGDLTAKVIDNAFESDNDLHANLNSTQLAFQTNDADVDNDLRHLDSDTGENDANFNNAGGAIDTDPSVTTGNANTTVTVDNTANTNTLGNGSTLDLSDLMDNVNVSFNMTAMWAAFLGMIQ